MQIPPYEGGEERQHRPCKMQLHVLLREVVSINIWGHIAYKKLRRCLDIAENVPAGSTSPWQHRRMALRFTGRKVRVIVVVYTEDIRDASAPLDASYKEIGQKDAC